MDAEENLISQALTLMRLILFKLRNGFDLKETSKHSQAYNRYMMNTLDLSEEDLRSTSKMRNLINITGLNMEMDIFEILKKHNIKSIQNLFDFFFSITAEVN